MLIKRFKQIALSANTAFIILSALILIIILTSTLINTQAIKSASNNEALHMSSCYTSKGLGRNLDFLKFYLNDNLKESHRLDYKNELVYKIKDLIQRMDEIFKMESAAFISADGTIYNIIGLYECEGCNLTDLINQSINKENEVILTNLEADKSKATGIFALTNSNKVYIGSLVFELDMRIFTMEGSRDYIKNILVFAPSSLEQTNSTKCDLCPSLLTLYKIGIKNEPNIFQINQKTFSVNKLKNHDLILVISYDIKKPILYNTYIWQHIIISIIGALLIFIAMREVFIKHIILMANFSKYYTYKASSLFKVNELEIISNKLIEGRANMIETDIENANKNFIMLKMQNVMDAELELTKLLKHEFNTSLHHIIGSTKLLKSSAMDKNCIEELLGAIEKAAEGLSNNFEKVLGAVEVYSKRAMMQEDYASLDECIISSIEKIKPVAFKKNIKIDERYDASLLPQVLMDRQYFEQAIVYILKHMISIQEYGANISIMAYRTRTGIIVDVINVGFNEAKFFEMQMDKLSDLNHLSDDLFLNLQKTLQAGNNGDLLIAAYILTAHNSKLFAKHDKDLGSIARISIPNIRLGT